MTYHIFIWTKSVPVSIAFIECIHGIISWCQSHDGVEWYHWHRFHDQGCWNHIWLFAPFMFMIPNDSNNRLSCLLKQQARIMFNGSPSLIPSCSTSIWTWFTASMIFIGRLTCRFRSFNAARMLPLCSCQKCSPWIIQCAYCPHVRNGIMNRNTMPCSSFPPCVSITVVNRDRRIILRSFAFKPSSMSSWLDAIQHYTVSSVHCRIVRIPAAPVVSLRSSPAGRSLISLDSSDMTISPCLLCLRRIPRHGQMANR